MLYQSISLADNKDKVVVILYPSAPIGKDTIYNEIIRGFSINTDQFIKKKIKITPESDEKIKQQILTYPLFAIIAIGKDASDFAYSTTSKFPIITVGTLLTNDNYDQLGISLSLNEDALKKKLHLYLPDIKKVHIADDGRNIIYFSGSTFAPLFIHKKITDINKITKYLWDLINTVDSRTEAIWINSSLDPSFIYKLAERAWERNVTLLSHNRDHLEKGIVLVFYPDFNGMGERAGQILIHLQNNEQLEGLQPLTAIYQGINLRTAKHLGISSLISKKEFKVILK